MTIKEKTVLHHNELLMNCFMLARTGRAAQGNKLAKEVAYEGLQSLMEKMGIPDFQKATTEDQYYFTVRFLEQTLETLKDFRAKGHYYDI